MFKNLKRIFLYKFHLRTIFTPWVLYKISHLEDLKCLNSNKREIPIILSLTSYRERFKDLQYTLYSLLNQTVKPDKVILWLDKDYEDLSTLPYEITQFIKNGLEIRFVEDLKSYTKVFYAFQEYNENIIITADDDIYYPKNWLEKLYHSYISNPDDIHVHRAHRVLVNGEHILPYGKWPKHVQEETARFDNFLTGVGGVLYPPKCFTREVLRKDIFLKVSPTADDIWFWVMALVHNRKIRVVRNHNRSLYSVNLLVQIFGRTLYKRNRQGLNDEQLTNLLKYYKNNVMNRIKMVD